MMAARPHRHPLLQHHVARRGAKMGDGARMCQHDALSRTCGRRLPSLSGKVFKMLRIVLAAVVILSTHTLRAETPQEWAALGARVHGGYGAFIPLGIKIGLDASEKLKAGPRGLTLLYFDNPKAPCACFADGIAIATGASVGQRSLVVAKDHAPDNAAAVIVIRPRKGGEGLKYTIPMAALPRLGAINKELADPVARHEAVMKADGLFLVETAQ
jgi:hypothetical protein